MFIHVSYSVLFIDNWYNSCFSFWRWKCTNSFGTRLVIIYVYYAIHCIELFSSYIVSRFTRIWRRSRYVILFLCWILIFIILMVRSSNDISTFCWQCTRFGTFQSIWIFDFSRNRWANSFSTYCTTHLLALDVLQIWNIWNYLDLFLVQLLLSIVWWISYE